MGEAHAQDPVARREHREERGEVRRRPRVRLDVDVLGAGEEGERTVLGEPLDHVHVLAAAVVAPGPGRPSAYLLVSQEPCASMTAANV